MEDEEEERKNREIEARIARKKRELKMYGKSLKRGY